MADCPNCEKLAREIEKLRNWLHCVIDTNHYHAGHLEIPELCNHFVCIAARAALEGK